MKKNNHIATSIKGSRNTKQNKPCEDFFVYKTVGNKTIGIVADGAGSAKHAKIGARLICNTLADFLTTANINNVNQKVINATNFAREKLLSHRFNQDKSLKDFAATFIGFFYHNNQGVVFHVGDGTCVGLDKDNNPTISAPHNGYFACETFFYTMDNWQEHLRFMNIKNLKSIFLLTDGISPFAIDGATLRENFLIPIDDFLASDKSKAQKLMSLKKTLDNPTIRKLNSDDKTLLWSQL